MEAKTVQAETPPPTRLSFRQRRMVRWQSKMLLSRTIAPAPSIKTIKHFYGFGKLFETKEMRKRLQLSLMNELGKDVGAFSDGINSGRMGAIRRRAVWMAIGNDGKAFFGEDFGEFERALANAGIDYSKVSAAPLLRKNGLADRFFARAIATRLRAALTGTLIFASMIGGIEAEKTISEYLAEKTENSQIAQDGKDDREEAITTSIEKRNGIDFIDAGYLNSDSSWPKAGLGGGKAYVRSIGQEDGTPYKISGRGFEMEFPLDITGDGNEYGAAIARDGKIMVDENGSVPSVFIRTDKHDNTSVFVGKQKLFFLSGEEENVSYYWAKMHVDLKSRTYWARVAAMDDEGKEIRSATSEKIHISSDIRGCNIAIYQKLEN